MSKTTLTAKVSLDSETAFINGYKDNADYRVRQSKDKKPYIMLLGEQVILTSPRQQAEVDGNSFTIKVSSTEEFVALQAA